MVRSLVRERQAVRCYVRADGTLIKLCWVGRTGAMKGTQGEWIAAADIGNASGGHVGRPTTYGVEIWATARALDGA